MGPSMIESASAPGEQLVWLPGRFGQVSAGFHALGIDGSSRLKSVAYLAEIGQREYAGLPDQQIVAPDHDPPVAAAVAHDVVEQRTVRTVQPQWMRASGGHDQPVLGRQQIALGRNARVMADVVVDADALNVAQAGVCPTRLARADIESPDEDAHRGPYAAGKVDRLVLDHGAAADRPMRDQPVVAQQSSVGSVGRQCAVFPQQIAAVQVQAPEATVVGPEQHAAVVQHGREPDRRLGIVTPPFLAGFDRIGPDAGVGGAGHHQHAVGTHGLVRAVELLPRLVRIGQLVARQAALPVKFDRFGKWMRREA
jgi:hypothetical protein